MGPSSSIAKRASDEFQYREGQKKKRGEIVACTVRT